MPSVSDCLNNHEQLVNPRHGRVSLLSLLGILGTAPTEAVQRRLCAMLDSVQRRRDIDVGTFCDSRLMLSSGWLGSQERSQGASPIWNERGDVCLLFSGEDFTSETAIARLRVHGHEVIRGNLSYLVRQYEEFGLAFLQTLNGAFNGLLIDLRDYKAVLFNDRYGLNRIYYYETEQGLYFASEAKALLTVLPSARSLDQRSLGEFISCGCVLQNRTLFSGISLLPPASVWTFSPGQEVKKNTYFSAHIWENQAVLTPGQYYDEFKTTWRRVLRRYCETDQRIALSLTGGLDSRMILACAGGAPGSLPCYTFGGQYRECNDVKIARAVAGICRQPHKVICVDRDFLKEFPALAERAVYLSDGAMDVSGSIDIYLQRSALEIAPVRVTGTNGGEILRRLVAFRPARLCRELFSNDLTRFAEEAFTTYASELQGHTLSFIAFKQAPWYLGSKFPLERSQVILRMPYFDNELVALSYQAPPPLTTSNEPARRLIAEANPALSRIATDRGCAARSFPSLSWQLFQQFSFKAEYAYDYGMPQWLARLDRLLTPLQLERAFLGRHKFHHFRIWYRDQLSSYVKDILIDTPTRSRPYLNPKAVEKIVASHTHGHRNYTQEIHKLLAIELVERHLVGAQS